MFYPTVDGFIIKTNKLPWQLSETFRLTCYYFVNTTSNYTLKKTVNTSS